MEYLYEYLVFLAKATTILVVVFFVVSLVASLSMRRQHAPRGHLQVRKLNDSFKDMKQAVQQMLLSDPELKKQHKQEVKQEKARRKGKIVDEEPRRRIFVLNFDGDISASEAEHLRHEVSAIVSAAGENDEVLVKVESLGGMVHTYGFAASQLARIRAKGIPLTTAIDKVAASGGYMMAVVADRILAAPFALVGSIGVVAQIPNVHRLLKKHDVDVEVLTAGQYKRTLTIFGENTDEGRRKFIEELEDVHALFQEFIRDNRPNLDVERVATGEAWYGRRAVDLGLVDELMTSDEYLLQSADQADLLEVKWVEHKRPIERMMAQATAGLSRMRRVLFGQ